MPSLDTAQSIPTAYTVQDACKHHTKELKLVHRKIRCIPSELHKLTTLTTLDLSDNPIDEFSDAELPDSIATLMLTGCNISAIPAGLCSLPYLKELFLAANRITNMDILFSCPFLLHCGLSYNQIGGISSSILGLSTSPLMSLDLAHNDMCNLWDTLSALRQLSQLRSLSLKGNPVCLMQNYRESLLSQIPKLVWLDDQKLDGISASSASSRPGSTVTTIKRPGSTTAADPALAAAAAAAAAAGATSWAAAALSNPEASLLVELSKLQIQDSQDVFAMIRASQQQQNSTGNVSMDSAAAASSSESHDGPQAGAINSSGADSARLKAQQSQQQQQQQQQQSQAPVPLKPVWYHMEITDSQGVSYCSTPVIIQPPAPAEPTAANTAAPAPPASGKDGKKASAGAGAGKGKPTTKAAPPKAAAATRGRQAGGRNGKGRISADDTPVGGVGEAMQPGLCRVLAALTADLAGRDWLRQGPIVSLYRTHYEPLPMSQQPQAVHNPPAAAANVAPAAIKATSKAPAKDAAAATQPLPAAAPTPQWQYTTQQTLLGTCKLDTAPILECRSNQADGSVQFATAPRLFDERGIRMALEDPRQQQLAGGSMQYRVVLHYQAPAS
eukprot:jgi/Chrzof1/11287/Cz05g31050.t1